MDPTSKPHGPGDPGLENPLDDANRILEQALADTDDPEKRAYCCLQLGVLMEEHNAFGSAARWYSRGHALEPLDGPLWYFLNNNLGYSLNQILRFPDAEGYCRAAIAVDGSRHNAYKNLGVSLTGQKRFAEAAASFVKATRTLPADRRALLCLEHLVAARPELLSAVPDLERDLADCRRAVQAIPPRGERIGLWPSWADLAAEEPRIELPVLVADRLPGWDLREENIPGREPAVVYVDSRGHHGAAAELRPPGPYRWTMVDLDDVPEAAIEMHDAAVAACQSGDFREGIDQFRRAHRLAPRWALPVYNAAWTALHNGKTDRARALFSWLDRMVPEGYWTTKTALDCLTREIAGEYPSGMYMAYLSIEREPDRTALTEQVVKQFPTFAPAWKDLAALRTSLAGREEAVTRGLESRPDRETKAFLHIHRAAALDSRGERTKARAPLQELITGSEGTIQTRAVASMMLFGMETSSR